MPQERKTTFSKGDRVRLEQPMLLADQTRHAAGAEIDWPYDEPPAEGAVSAPHGVDEARQP